MGAKAARALRAQGLLWGVWRLGHPWPGPCREGVQEAGTAGRWDPLRAWAGPCARRRCLGFAVLRVA